MESITVTQAMLLKEKLEKEHNALNKLINYATDKYDHELMSAVKTAKCMLVHIENQILQINTALSNTKVTIVH